MEFGQFQAAVPLPPHRHTSFQETRFLFPGIVTCTIIATVCMALRIWCKLKTEPGINWDDAFIFLSVASTYVVLIMFSRAYHMLTDPLNQKDLDTSVPVQHGIPIPSVGLAWYQLYLWVIYAVIISCQYTAKVAVCLLYRLIFSVHQFRLVCSALIAISTVWWFAVTAPMYACLPNDSMVIYLRPKNCMIDFGTINTINNAIEIVIDLAILMIPLRVVRPMKLNKKKKVFVLAMFLAGAIAVITNIIRTYYQWNLYKNRREIRKNPTGWSEYTFFWMILHSTINIVCACLPVYGPLMAKLGGVLARLKSRTWKSDLQQQPQRQPWWLTWGRSRATNRVLESAVELRAAGGINQGERGEQRTRTVSGNSDESTKTFRLTPDYLPTHTAAIVGGQHANISQDNALIQPGTIARTIKIEVV